METTKDDLMNQEALRKDSMNDWPYGDEQAQSQDRERLQSEIQEAWDRLREDHDKRRYSYYGPSATEVDIKLLKWALGVK